MAITVGTLVVDLQANTASFVSGLDKAGQISMTSARNISRAFNVMAGVVSAAFLAAEGAMVAMVESAITNAARLHDVAQAAGTSTAALSALEYAAKQSGLSAEQLDKGLEKMAKSMLAAASAGRDGQSAYKTLGVAVADATGRLRPTQDVLTDLAAKFKTMPDGPMKTAAALQIFGRAGADLVPLLNEGKEGITALMAEAQRLGLVVGDDFANAADQFEDSMERMKGAAQGAANSIARDSLPYLNYILQSISDNLANTQSRFYDLAAASGISIQAIIVLFSQFQTAIDDTRLRFRHFAAEGIISTDAMGKALKAVLSGNFEDLAGISDRAKAHIAENDRLFVADENRLWKDNAAAITEYLLAPERASSSRKAIHAFSVSASPSGAAGKLGAPVFTPATELKTQSQLLEEIAEAIRLVNLAAGETGGAEKFLSILGTKLPTGWPDELKALETQVDVIFTKLAADTEAVQGEVERGAISQIEGAQRIVDLHRQAGAELDALIPRYRELAALTGDPRLGAGVEALAARVKNLQRETSVLGQHLRETFVDGFADAVGDIVNGTQSMADAFKNMARSILADLASIITKMLMMGLITSIFGGGAGGAGGGASGLFSSIFGGGRQGGGDVNPGQFYLVGENGPEVLAPQVPGTIIPHGAISAGGGQQMTQQNYVTIHVETPDVDSFNRSREQIAGDFGAALSRAARRR